MNYDDRITVWREHILPALSPDDRKQVQEVFLSLEIIAYRLANKEYREGDIETIQDNQRTLTKILSTIQKRLGD